MSGHARSTWLPRRLPLVGLALAAAAVVGTAASVGSARAPQERDASTLAAGIERALQPAEDAAPMAAAPDLRAQLDLQLQRHPRDVRALVLRARLDMEEQRYDDAAARYEQALQAPRSRAAADPAVWVEYAEAVGMRQGRTLAGKPLELVQRALALDPAHPGALDLAGSAAFEAKDYAAAAAHWKRLLAQLPAGSPRHVELTAAIRGAEQRARLALPAARS